MEQTAVPRWQVPGLEEKQRLLGGVAGGIATELGVEPVVIRAGFVLLTLAGGWGILLYGICWVWFLAHARGEDTPVGPRVAKGASNTERVMGVGLVVLGLLLMIRSLGLGFSDSVVWPTGVIAVGALVVWHRRSDPLNVAEGPKDVVRVFLGAVIAGTGFFGMLLINVDWDSARTTLLLLAVVLLGAGLLLGPWAWRLVDDLSSERLARIRSEERAEVAAHLHDSVLQTLALIQQQAQDPQATVTLARTQERELRTWLFGGAASGQFVDRIETAAAKIEKDFGVAVEVVTVGDLEVSDPEDAIIRAANEAMVNAAKHAGVGRIDVFAEVADDKIEVFVRDTGVGFDLEAVDSDRLGIAESILGRLERAGGVATVTSAPGAGTEVELSIPRSRQ